MKLKGYGFTIVELLVVIVVVAILATISIVSYTSIQDRARIAVIQSNISTAAKHLEIWNLDNGHYPVTSNEIRTGDRPIPETVWTRSPDPYSLVLYCSNGTDYILAGRKIGVPIRYWYAGSSTGGVREATSLTVPGSSNAVDVCNDFGMAPDGRYQTWLKAWAGWAI